MITVDFGDGERRSDGDITAKWVQEAFRKSLFDSNSLCIKIVIESEDVQLSLNCGACPDEEKAKEKYDPPAEPVVKLWRSYKLDQEKFSYRNLEGFLKKLFNYFDMKFKRV